MSKIFRGQAPGPPFKGIEGRKGKGGEGGEGREVGEGREEGGGREEGEGRGGKEIGWNGREGASPQIKFYHYTTGILRSTTPPSDNNVNTVHKVKRSLTSIKSAQSQSHLGSQQSRNKQLTKQLTTSNTSAIATRPTCTWCEREKQSTGLPGR
jgi:hypothetical protein